MVSSCDYFNTEVSFTIVIITIIIGNTFIICFSLPAGFVCYSFVVDSHLKYVKQNYLYFLF